MKCDRCDNELVSPTAREDMIGRECPKCKVIQRRLFSDEDWICILHDMVYELRAEIKDLRSEMNAKSFRNLR